MNGRELRKNSRYLGSHRSENKEEVSNNKSQKIKAFVVANDELNKNLRASNSEYKSTQLLVATHKK